MGRTVMSVKGGRSLARAISAHDLGDVTAEALVKEAECAVGHLRCGAKAMLEGDLHQAMDDFFKAAAIACNVTFTARTHETPLPEEVVAQMCVVTRQATHGIKHVMKAIVTKKMLDHEALMHPLAKHQAVGSLSDDDDFARKTPATSIRIAVSIMEEVEPVASYAAYVRTLLENADQMLGLPEWSNPYLKRALHHAQQAYGVWLSGGMGIKNEPWKVIAKMARMSLRAAGAVPSERTFDNLGRLSRVMCMRYMQGLATDQDDPEFHEEIFSQPSSESKTVTHHSFRRLVESEDPRGWTTDPEAVQTWSALKILTKAEEHFSKAGQQYAEGERLKAALTFAQAAALAEKAKAIDSSYADEADAIIRPAREMEAKIQLQGLNQLSPAAMRMKYVQGLGRR